MRKFIALVCLLTLIVVPVAAKPKFAPNLPIGASDEIEIEIGKTNGKSNGKSVSLSAAPMIHNGRTYMPLRSLGGLLGAKVDYHPKKDGDEIVLKFPSFSVHLELNSKLLIIKQGSTEHRKDMGLPVIANRGTAFVPLVPLAQAIGYSVAYNPSGKVKIRKNPSDEPVIPTPTDVRFERPSNQTLKFTLTPQSPKVIIGNASDILAKPGEHANKQVLVVYRGQFSSGGYRIAIKNLTADKNALKIDVTLTNPASEYYSLTNHPYDVVVLTGTTTQFTTWNSAQLGKGNIELPPTANINLNRLGQVALKQRLNPKNYTVVVGKAQDLLQNLGQVQPESQVMVVYRGECGGGGYGIEVTSASYRDGVATLGIKRINPAPGSFNTLALTYPYDVMVVPANAQFASWVITEGAVKLATGPVVPATSVSFTRLNNPPLKIDLEPKQPKVVVGKAKDILQSLNGLSGEAQLAVIYRGEFGNTGYGIKVETLSIGNHVAHIGVNLPNPLSDHSYAQVVSYPYDVIVLPTGATFDTWVLTAGSIQLGSGTVTSLNAVGFVHVGQVPLKVDLKPEAPLVIAGTVQSLLRSSTLDADTPIVVVYRGELATTGYGIVPTLVTLADGTLEIAASLTGPSNTSIAQPNYPYYAFALPKGSVMSSWVLKTGSELLGKDILNKVVAFTDAPTGLDLTWASLRQAGVAKKVMAVNGLRKLVVVVKYGQAPTSGYGLELKTAWDVSNDVIDLDVLYTEPSSNEVVAQAVTYPYQAYVFDAALQPKSFELRERTSLLIDWSVVTYELNLARVDRTIRGLQIGYGKDLLVVSGDEANSLFAVVKRGQSPTLGYGIAVTSMELVEKDVVRIYAKSITPTSNSVGQAITYPYQVVKLNPNLASMSFEFYLDGVKVLPQTTK